MFKKILIPIDLNDLPLSKAALEKATGFAKVWGCDVRLVYVMPIVPSTYLEYVPADFESSERKRVDAEIAELAKGLGLDAAKVSTIVRAGGVYHEVLEEAGECKADLIVIGSHWPTLVTYLVGSHATSIVRHANCSVLVVR